MAELDFRVPDAIEPFVAWRVWDVTIDGPDVALESMFHKQVWKPGTVTAKCQYGCAEVPGDGETHILHGVHSMPCGIYAGITLEQAAGYLPDGLRDPRAVKLPATRAVIGKVAMWGIVCVHERGYRAQYAKPLEVFVPVSFRFRCLPDDAAILQNDAERAARLLAWRYDIPTRLFRRVNELVD